MKVTLDTDLCEGYGNCAGHLPEIFLLDDDGYAYLDENDNGEVPPGEEGAARRAILDCPVHAIAEADE